MREKYPPASASKFTCVRKESGETCSKRFLLKFVWLFAEVRNRQEKISKDKNSFISVSNQKKGAIPGDDSELR